MTARAEATLAVVCADADEARALEAALGPENGDRCQTRVEGARLWVTVPEASMGSVAETVDDVLANVRAARESARGAAGRRA